MSNVINLDQHRSLFRDDAAYDEFVRMFSNSLQFDLRPIVYRNNIIGATLSADGAKDVLYDRMVKTISNRPEVLDELLDRLEDDEIVE